jgi:mannose-6-phosphate isomerase-like protein (cupin superfamily)
MGAVAGRVNGASIFAALAGYGLKPHERTQKHFAETLAGMHGRVGVGALLSHSRKEIAFMDRTPPPTSLSAALTLPFTPGRSAEVFVDGDLEVRFAAHPTDGPQVPHERDELYVVAAGAGRYRVEDKVTEVGPGDLLFCAARVPHGFEDISDDFCVWVIFYGPRK